MIRRQEEAAEEIVGGAVARMAGRAPEHEIQVEAPEGGAHGAHGCQADYAGAD